MKVLIIPEYSEFGGTLTFFRRLIDVYTKHGIEIDILVPVAQARHEVLEYARALGCRVHVRMDRKRIFFRRFVSLLFDVWFVFPVYWRARPDHIVVTCGTPGLMQGVLLFPRSVSLVMLTSVRDRTRPSLRRIWRALTRSGRKRLVVDSRYSAAQLAENFGVSPANIEVIYNSFRADRNFERQVRGTPLVLTLGHVEDFKNPFVWIDVAQIVCARRSGVSFLWLGSGGLLERARAEVVARGLESSVEFLGFRSDLDSFYGRATVYFQPSLLESHGISLVDAMAYGIPCVSSSAGGLPESNAHGETGYVCAPDDTAEYGRRIVELIDDPQLRKKLGQAASDRARRLFSEQRQAEQLLALLPNREI